MEAKAIWKSRLTFTGTADSGFEVPLGAEPSVGGDHDGFKPLELIAIGLAGCTGMDVISILNKKRQDVTAFEVQVRADRAKEHPRVFTKIHITYVITGNQVDPKAAERAIELSETKYCPAHAMLKEVSQMTSTYQIREAS
jgi:putative redox protein